MSSIPELLNIGRDSYIETLQKSMDLIFNLEYTIRDSYSLKSELDFGVIVLGVGTPS